MPVGSDVTLIATNLSIHHLSATLIIDINLTPQSWQLYAQHLTRRVGIDMCRIVIQYLNSDIGCITPKLSDEQRVLCQGEESRIIGIAIAPLSKEAPNYIYGVGIETQHRALLKVTLGHQDIITASVQDEICEIVKDYRTFREDFQKLVEFAHWLREYRNE